MKASVLRYAAIGMATMSLAGFAAASTVTVGNTGPDSTQKVDLNNATTATTSNLNAVGVSNFGAQGAESGDVKASDNTTVEGASGSGAAANTSTSTTGVSVNNGSSMGAWTGLLGSNDAPTSVTIDTTGPDSENKVNVNNEKNVQVQNTNLLQVQNTNLQSAKSGNVDVKHNTTAGGATSGGASNTSTTVNSVNVSN